MCDIPSTNASSGGGSLLAKLGGATVAAAILYGAVKASETPKAPPPKPTPAPAVVHAGTPWWVYGLSALVLVVLAVAATLLVQRVSRRRRVPQPQPQRQVQQRALTRGPQRELTTSAQAWVRQPEKTEVKR